MKRQPGVLLAHALLTVAWEVVVPLILVIGLPLLLNTPWSVMLLYQPDITFWLIAMMLLSAGTGITQAVLVVIVLLRRRVRSRLERWRKSRRQPSCKISALEQVRKAFLQLPLVMYMNTAVLRLLIISQVQITISAGSSQFRLLS